MTQMAGVRAPSVTAARVIILIVSVIAGLVALATIVFGVIGLISGAAVAGNAVGTDSAAVAGAFGGAVGIFSGAVLVQGAVSLAFVALWVWAAIALGRASRAARIVVTVLCGLDVLLGLALLVLAVRESGGAAIGLAALVVIGVPAVLIVLLWGPASARRYFTPGPAAVAPGGPWQQHGGWAQPAPVSPPVGLPMPAPRDQEPVTTPMRLPALCRQCGTTLAAGSAFCGGCGSATAAPRHARA